MSTNRLSPCSGRAAILSKKCRKRCPMNSNKNETPITPARANRIAIPRRTTQRTRNASAKLSHGYDILGHNADREHTKYPPHVVPFRDGGGNRGIAQQQQYQACVFIQ